MKKLTIALALLVAGCGSTTITTTENRSVTPPTSTTTVTASASSTTATALKASSCSYANPQAANCEPVPAPNSCHFRHDGQTLLPDPACTPGATNPSVTLATAPKTVCKSGYTSTIRPPTSYTGPLKKRLMAAYGLAGKSTAGYELDHLIPLEGGGTPSDPANLWPQQYATPPNSHEKDHAENTLRADICAGKIKDLGAVQAALANDWLKAPV